MATYHISNVAFQQTMATSTTAAGWLAAPMDTGTEGAMTEEQAEELAEAARAGTAAAINEAAGWHADN
jgi:hypothetical protein